MTLTDRDRKIALAIAPVLLIVAYLFLLLAPKREEAATAADELSKQEQRRDAAQSAAGRASLAKTDFQDDYAETVRLGKAIPAQVDMPSLLVQLDSAAEGTGIRFTRVATGAREGAAATAAPAQAGSTPSGGSNATPAQAGGETAQSAPGGAAESANNAQQTSDQKTAAAEQSGLGAGETQTSASGRQGGLPVGGGQASGSATSPAGGAPAGLETVPLELDFVGNFFHLADFFHQVKRFVRVANSTVVVDGRLITIEGVRWTSDPQLFPRIKAELTATVYLSPKAEGASAGATPQGPAASQSTPASAGSAPAPGAPQTPIATAAP